MTLIPAWFLYAATSILLWSSLAYIGTRLEHVPPFLLLGIAFLIGSIPSLKRYRVWFSDLKILAVGVVGIFGYHFFLFTAFRHASPVKANLINYLWPILIVLTAPFLLEGYQLRATHVLGGAMAFAGAALVVTGGHLHFDSTEWLGYGLAFCAAVTWSLYSIMTKKLSAFPTSVVGGFCFISGLLSIVLYFFSEPVSGGMSALSARDFGYLLILGIGPMGIAFYTWDMALKKGDPRVVGALSYFTPLLSTGFLIVLGGRKAGGSIFLALALIVSGAIVGSIDLFKPRAELHSSHERL